MSLKASISGIRGIIGESLTPQIIIDYICSFSQILQDGPILIGRDSRVSGEMILYLTKGILNSLGRDTVDLGIVPTPIVLYGVNNGNFAGGIIITASHNPEQWNALKFVNNKGKFLSPSEFLELSDKYKEKKFKFVDYNKIGKNYFDNKIIENHKNTILKFIDSEKIKSKSYKVVFDTVNGASGYILEDFLNSLGCITIGINKETTGLFSHPPEPTPKNLTKLSEEVIKNKADIGFALDPDGDRLVICDKQGEVLSEELTLALCIDHYLSYFEKTDVVINLSTSKISEDIVVKKHNQKCFRVATGEINVTEKMEQINSKIGGEGNGGIICYKLNKCRDAIVGISLILDMMSKTNKSIKDLINEYPEYYLIKEKIEVNDNIIKNYSFIENKIIENFKNQKINKDDGIRIEFEDKWVLIRKSNTEPIIRIFSEAKSKKEAEELFQIVNNFFKF